MNKIYNSIHTEWLNKAHSRIIYKKIDLIPPRHFYNLINKCNYNYNTVCTYLQSDNFC